MRARLLGVFVALMVCILAALSVPFAERVASDQQQAMFLDRLQDATRFASAAEQATDDLDEQALQADLVRYHTVFGVAAAIVDRIGAIRQSSGSIDLRDSVVAHAEQLALSGHQSPNPPVVWPTSRAVMAVAVPIIRGDDVIGAALTVSSTAHLRGALSADLALLALVDLAALAVFVLLASWLATWVLLPVYVVDGAARRISAGDLATRVSAEKGPIEVRRLATSFNQMAEAVQSALERQQAFVADASHQLRNPLTTLGLRLELLAEGVDNATRAELEEILDETGRLNTVLGQLLELAAVQHSLSASPDSVDAVPMVVARVAGWRPAADRRNVSLELRHPRSAPARIDETLASSILDALLDNAIKFSPPGGRVAVRVTDEADAVRIEVADQGPGVDEAELDRIGDRFWRSPATLDVPGSGLGLSIARELADVLGARLSFDRAVPNGLRVALTLPKTLPVPALSGAGVAASC